MKKTIMIETLLLFVFCVALACSIKILDYAVTVSKSLEHYLNGDITYFDPALQNDQIRYYTDLYHTALSYGIPALFAAVADLAAMVIIAVKDLPCFKPFVDKFKARKTARNQAKAEQAAIAKQERIDKLQAELDELKKDE